MIDLEEKLFKQVNNLLANEGFQVSKFTNEYSKTTYYLHENFKIQIIGSLHLEIKGATIEVNLEFDEVKKLQRKYNLKNRKESASIFADIEESCLKYKNYFPH